MRRVWGCCPKSDTFLDAIILAPLIEHYEVDSEEIIPELRQVKCLVEDEQIVITELMSFLPPRKLSQFYSIFYKLCSLYQ